MGLKDDLHRFREVGEERRQDLADFIQHGDLGQSGEDRVRIPVKIVELPGFRYDELDAGGVGQGDAAVGDPVRRPGPRPGDEAGDPGDQAGDHDYYEMDPEEFAAQLDEELGLHLEPKGKAVRRVDEDAFTDVSRAGPRSTLDVEHLFRRGLKRKLATAFDEEYVREALRVDGWGPDEVFRWARRQGIHVSKAWIVDQSESIDEPDRWGGIEEMEGSVERTDAAAIARRAARGRLPFRREDERFRYPEVVEEREHNVVVVNIRDVSGSMGEAKRELVERTFSPLDWYLQGKYDTAEFVYVAHDTEAWRVERRDFFGIRSGGGTQISSAYALTRELLESEYPWSRWNRYVFAAGDSENSPNDTTERVIPLMEAIDANLHAYVETRPDGERRRANHADAVADHFDGADDVAVVRVHDAEDVIGAIETILETEAVEA